MLIAVLNLTFLLHQLQQSVSRQACLRTSPSMQTSFGSPKVATVHAAMVSNTAVNALHRMVAPAPRAVPLAEAIIQPHRRSISRCRHHRHVVLRPQTAFIQDLDVAGGVGVVGVGHKFASSFNLRRDAGSGVGAGSSTHKIQLEFEKQFCS